MKTEFQASPSPSV